MIFRFFHDNIPSCHGATIYSYQVKGDPMQKLQCIYYDDLGLILNQRHQLAILVGKGFEPPGEQKFF
jgi:hypothetical protein